MRMERVFADLLDSERKLKQIEDKCFNIRFNYRSFKASQTSVQICPIRVIRVLKQSVGQVGFFRQRYGSISNMQSVCSENIQLCSEKGKTHPGDPPRPSLSREGDYPRDAI